MTHQADQNRLEDVLFQYVESVEKPTHKALMDWVGRYPEYKTQLIEFTVTWSQLERLPASAQQDADVDETTLVLRGMSVVKNLLHEMGSETTPTHSTYTPIVSLIAQAAKVGLTLNQLAERARLSVPLVRNLDLRQIRPATVPDQAIQTFAVLLEKSIEAVSAYFFGHVRAIANQNFRSDQAPLIIQQDFFEAVREDILLKEEDREYWLAFRPPDKDSRSR